MLCCPDTSTCWPRPVRRRAKTASSAPAAAYIPVQNGDCGRLVRTGAPPGSPASHRQPLDAVTSARGPEAPYGVIVTTTRRGSARAGSTTIAGWSTTSAPRTSASRVAASPGARTTLRLFAFSAIHRRPRSRSARSPTYGGTRRTGSPSGGSAFTTSAPRSARVRPQCATAAAPHTSFPTSSTTRRSGGRGPRSASEASVGTAALLAAALRQHLGPRLRLHERLALDDLVRVEPARRIDPVDRVDGTHEVVLVAEGHRGVDRHAALEARVHRGPLRAAGGEPLRRDEGLSGAARRRAPDVVARVHARGERPDDVVHRVDVDVLVDRDAQAQTRAARERRREEVAHEPVVGLEALLHLKDRAGPVGHRERDVHVVDETGL